MVPGSGGEHADDDEQGPDSEQADDILRPSGGAASTLELSHKDNLVNDAIGKALQAHYKALADAPLPDRFLILLAELEAKDSHDEK